jgi:HSP20 family molecular chaperone IbpA
MAELVKQENRSDAPAVERTRDSVTYVPRFDIWENQDELVLYGDLPGVDPSDLDVRFENNELTLHGRVRGRHDDIAFLYGEYGIGDFHRTFTIGEAIDSTKISAELRNGVLTLRLPKTEAVKPRRIAVKTA